MLVAGTAEDVKDGAGWSVACAANKGRDKATTEDRDRSEGVVVVDLPSVGRDREMICLLQFLSDGM